MKQYLVKAKFGFASKRNPEVKGKTEFRIEQVMHGVSEKDAFLQVKNCFLAKIYTLQFCDKPKHGERYFPGYENLKEGFSYEYTAEELLNVQDENFGMRRRLTRQGNSNRRAGSVRGAHGGICARYG